MQQNEYNAIYKGADQGVGVSNGRGHGKDQEDETREDGAGIKDRVFDHDQIQFATHFGTAERVLLLDEVMERKDEEIETVDGDESVEDDGECQQ